MTLSRIVFYAFLWIVISCSPALAENTAQNLAKISSQLSKNTKLCADFVQEKSLKVLNRPLISNGRMISLANRGVLWEVTTPFPSKVLVKETEMINWAEDGTKTHSSYARSPLFSALTQVFFAMFTGNLDKLETPFTMISNISEDAWQLNLTPTGPKLAKVISSIRVTGQEYVEEITIAEVRGDTTKISFHNITSDNCQLRKVEEASFAN